jgi:thiamine kinase-like enzyme
MGDMAGTNISPEDAGIWIWPFSRADLTAGLRRYFKDLSIRLTSVRKVSIKYQRPSIDLVSGIQVKYQGQKGKGACRLVVKEPRGTTRAGLAGVGRREVGVYQSLVSQLPMETPQLISAAPNGDWLLLDEIEIARNPSQWKIREYRKAIEELVELHNRFWGLREDLNNFPWLLRPLTADFEIHITAAENAIKQIEFLAMPEFLAGHPNFMKTLTKLATQAGKIAAPLKRIPHTLLHGDYWPGNIAVLRDGRHVVYDWQLTAIGPGIIDLLVFIKKSLWWFGPVPFRAEEMIGYYRERLAGYLDVAWEDKEWSMIWDHALMWRFLQEWVDLLAVSPDSILQVSAERLREIWLDPVTEAVARRLSDE